MKCDKCGISLTTSNNGGFAPYGIPLYVCKSCYNKLKESEKDLKVKEWKLKKKFWKRLIHQNIT